MWPKPEDFGLFALSVAAINKPVPRYSTSLCSLSFCVESQPWSAIPEKLVDLSDCFVEHGHVTLEFSYHYFLSRGCRCFSLIVQERSVLDTTSCAEAMRAK
jgi:hypothetical protein